MELFDTLKTATRSQRSALWHVRWIVMTIVLSVAALVWYVANYIHTEQIATLQSRIDDYEQRLHLVPAKESAYSRLSVSELVSASLDQVALIRSLRASCEARLRQLSDQQTKELKLATTPEAQTSMRQRFKLADETMFQNCLTTYRRELKMDAWLMRREIDNRLPRNERMGYENPRQILYFEPTNFFGLEIVADGLEGHARLLEPHSSKQQ